MFGIFKNNGAGASSRGYYLYSALVTQSGVLAPVSTVLYNDLPEGTPSWSYASSGTYELNLTSAFTDNKTFVFCDAIEYGSNGQVTFGISRIDQNKIGLETCLSGSPTDDLISFPLSIEIRVYI